MLCLTENIYVPFSLLFSIYCTAFKSHLESIENLHYACHFCNTEQTDDMGQLILFEAASSLFLQATAHILVYCQNKQLCQQREGMK